MDAGRGRLRVSQLAVSVLAAPPRLGGVTLVCVDGPSGAGKTTLAGALAGSLPGAVVLHMDDLYDGWAGLATVWPRVEDQVLGPLGAGEPARWRRYDWSLGRFDRWHELPVPAVLVLEGCGSAPRAVRGRASCVVWVDAPATVRHRRAADRDGPRLDPRLEEWWRTEEEYFAVERPSEHADVHVDGSVGWDR
ncbi:uridine kinase [Cellulomonas bogoriensis 69B4 = DSM 16987]|uniref:Uridine kinase n=1 Tax=Cellulomonas bogoriensis 69B4 = DSM 16987 TaxID=1386082 RepID=A0A0A0BZ70_9CELL|nr:uridine kinase [Cellulomonas bogoriensis 69B4 = DSM 16987]